MFGDFAFVVLGSGQLLTVILDQEYRFVRENGLLDLDQTLKLLKNVESVLDIC